MTILSVIGGITLVRCLLALGLFVKRHFTGDVFDATRLGAKRGGWAVVTGASDGIGKAYAVEAARRGFNVYLLSRTQSKLDDVCAEIKSKHSVEAKALAVDFCSIKDADWKKIGSEIQHLDVGLLVNNVGINYPYPSRFADPEATNELDQQIIDVNISVMNRMTKMVLPGMIEKRRGAIVNLSSFSGIVPTPLLAVYSGTKAYIDFFSQALQGEYVNQGIIVQSVTPAMVVSNMSKIRKPSLKVASPGAIARRSLGRLGAEPSLSPYYVHEILQTLMADLLPRSKALSIVAGENESVRKRALRRAEQKS